MKKGLILKEHSTLLNILLRITDGLCLLTIGIISFWIYFGNLNLGLMHKNTLLLGAIFGIISLSFFGAYRAWRGLNFSKEIKCIISATACTFLLILISAFITQSSEIYSHFWVINWLFASAVTISIYRFCLRKMLGALRAKGVNVRNVIIIGNGTLALKVFEQLKKHPEMGLIVKGTINTNIQTQEKESLFSDISKCLGNLDDLNSIVKNHKVDQVWITIPMNEVEKMEQVQSALNNSSVVIRMIPDIFGVQLMNQSMTEIAGLPVINIATSHMIDDKNRFIKSLEDKILATAILLAISPILLALSFIIKITSKGPVLFKQYRTGINGQDFEVYKFRSMVVHNEENGKVTQATKGDSRITPIGGFMRRTSLDELPQFINVLQGRMSIVGPRPHALAHNEHYKTLVESYMRRHMVKPGITGWAQINGFRGETDTIDKMEYRVQYDLYYIENWSIWFDLKIIYLTILKGFIHKNAL